MDAKPVKTGRVEPGERVTLEGIDYQVIGVFRGERDARDVARARPGLNYRIVRGQWCVLKRIQETPDYQLR